MQERLADEMSARGCPTPHATVSLLNGISGSFLDFDLLPDLLARAESNRGRIKITANWSVFLAQVGFKDTHIDPDELSAGMSAADCMAADAWRFAERLGFIESSGPTADGRQVAALAELEPERRRETLVSVLAPRVERRLRGQGDLPIVDLLRRAAGALEKTTNLWARECPGLIPVEVGAIVYWACINRRRAEELVDNIVSWRDVAMHRYQAPSAAAEVGEHAQLHFDRVSEFYGEHPFLGEKVPWSFGEESALCRLLVYCDLAPNLHNAQPAGTTSK